MRRCSRRVLDRRGQDNLTEAHKVYASGGWMVEDFKPWWSNCIVGQMSLALGIERPCNQQRFNCTIVR